MSPLLSVVVPFYGVEDYLAACLDSIQAQMMTDFEVILVDDGSPDRCAEIAQRYVDADPRFTLVRQANAGLGPARNTGTRHARGKYLMFVDSDDLLGPRAFSLLVGSLERTGSDIAAGNAWRFSKEKSTYPSWTHRVPFAADLEGTHVTEFPALIRDRMVWNKVYRREFWDAHGYEFPPIKYEDYPVTLKAHLEASAVDVIGQRIYLWRDRESGNSITQQVFKVDNARDRATSAHLVLDLLGDDVPEEVREDVHAYFIDIDLVALAGAIAAAPEADRAEVETIARDLAVRLHPQKPPRTTRLAKLIHAAILRGDFALVRSLADWRASGDRRALFNQIARQASPRQIAAIANAITRKQRRQNPLKPRRLETDLRRAEVVDGEIRLTVHAKLRRQFVERAKVSVAVGKHKLAAPVVTPAAGGMELRITIGPDDFGTVQEKALRPMISVSVGGPLLRWLGAIVARRPQDQPPLLPLEGGRYGQLARRNRNLAHLFLTALADPVVAEPTVDAAGATLRFPHLPTGTVVVQRPDPTPDYEAPIVDGVARLPWAEVMAGDPPDDPVTGLAYRPLYVPELVPTTDPDELNEARKERAEAGQRATDDFTLGRIYPLASVAPLDLEESLTCGVIASRAGWLEIIHDHHADGRGAPATRGEQPVPPGGEASADGAVLEASDEGPEAEPTVDDEAGDTEA